MNFFYYEFKSKRKEDVFLVGGWGEARVRESFLQRIQI